MASADLLRDLLRSLRSEAGAAFNEGLDTVIRMIKNILEQPEEGKYRTVRLANNAFKTRLGRFSSGILLLRALGFEDAFGDDAELASTGEPTHLALPVADPALLANGLVMVTAAREASDLLASEQQGAKPRPELQPPARPQPRSVEAVRSNAAGKRKATDSGTVDENSGKRPMTGDVSEGGCSKEEEEEEAATAVENAEELEAYTADAIDAHFLRLCGGPFLEALSASAVDGAFFARLVATARDCRRVVAATGGDAAAHDRAQHWVECLEEHGEGLGWRFDDVGEDDEALVSSAESVAAASSHANASGSSIGSSATAAASAAADAKAFEAQMPVEVIEDDGNFDTCSVCGLDGFLVCCEACPQAYHPACLGDQAPAENAPEEEAWFCPPCAAQLGMA